MAQKKTVLVVDDEIDVRTGVARMLLQHGYAVQAYGTAEDALLALREGVKADLMVLDIMLPGMTGLGLLREIRGPMRNRVPVILLTARSNSADIGDGYNKGAEFYLTKPFEPKTLLNAVDYLIGELPPEKQSLLEVELLTSENVYYGLRTITYR
ncbi:MAG: response regulator transcription factor [Planctomycetes bacterium]|nr:response regulator transcription factor [Planctomycetota bacterium]